MKTPSIFRTIVVVAGVTAPTVAAAQTCLGGAAGSSLAYEHQRASLVSGNGARANLVGGRAALSLGGAVQSADGLESTYGGDVGFALQFRAHRVTVCPVIGLRYAHSEWNPADAGYSLTSHILGASGGLTAGLEQHVARGVFVTPHLAARYLFRVGYLTSNSSSDDVEQTGDTLSTVEFDYGLTLRYQRFLAGWSARRNSDASGLRPNAARFFLAVAWGGRRDD